MGDSIEIAPEDLREAARGIRDLKGECEEVGKSLGAEIVQAMSLLPPAKFPEFQGRAAGIGTDLSTYVGPELGGLAGELEERAKAAEEAQSAYLRRASLGLQAFDNLVLKPGERGADRLIERQSKGREKALSEARNGVAKKAAELARLGQDLKRVPAGAEARLQAATARLEKQFAGALRAATRDLEAAESGMARAERDLEKASGSKVGHGRDQLLKRASDAENRLLQQQHLLDGVGRHVKDLEHDFAHDTDRATVAARTWAARRAGEVEDLMRMAGSDALGFEGSAERLGAGVSRLKVMGTVVKLGGHGLATGVSLVGAYLDYQEFYLESHDRLASLGYAGIGMGGGLLGAGLAVVGAPVLASGAAVIMVTTYDQTEYKYVYAHRDDLTHHPERFARQAGVDYMNTYYPGDDRYELMAEMMIIPGGQVIPEEKVAVHEVARSTGLTDSVQNTGAGRALKSWGWI